MFFNRGQEKFNKAKEDQKRCTERERERDRQREKERGSQRQRVEIEERHKPPRKSDVVNLFYLK